MFDFNYDGFYDIDELVVVLGFQFWFKGIYQKFYIYCFVLSISFLFQFMNVIWLIFYFFQFLLLFFIIGNKYIYLLMVVGNNVLRFEFEDYFLNICYVQYSSFNVDFVLINYFMMVFGYIGIVGGFFICEEYCVG